MTDAELLDILLEMLGAIEALDRESSSCSCCGGYRELRRKLEALRARA